MLNFFKNLFGHQLKTYDLYIPFGRSCHCTMILQNENLRSFSQVFDWLIPDDYGIEPIQTRFDLFHDFTPFFNQEDYSFHREKVSTSNHYIVTNNKYHFEIGHDFEITKSDEENLKFFKIKYLRRWKRTWTNIEKADKICFVYMVNTWTQMGATSTLDLNIVKENIQKLREKYPAKQIDFIIFEHAKKMKKGKIKTKKIDNGIIKYLSNHSYRANDNKFSDIITIKKILSNYKLSGKIQKDGNEH